VLQGNGVTLKMNYCEIRDKTGKRPTMKIIVSYTWVKTLCYKNVVYGLFTNRGKGSFR